MNFDFAISRFWAARIINHNKNEKGILEMKKVFFIMALLMISNSSFAVVNFSTKTGNLVMRDVSIDDGLTLYDSVTLNLDIATGTFTIVEAIKKAVSSFPETPLATVTEYDLKVDLHGCVETGRDEVTCLIKVVGLVGDKVITTGSVLNQLFDNFSREYKATTVSALSKTSMNVFQFNVIRGIPVEVKFIFTGIDPAATSFSLFRPYISVLTTTGGVSGGLIQPEFRDIPLIK